MNEDDDFYPINEMVNFLHNSHPEVLEWLKVSRPEFCEDLNQGVVCGSETPTQKRKEFIIELVDESLEEAIFDISKALNKARSAIHRSYFYKSIASYFSILMSCSTLGLIGVEENLKAQITSIGAFLGSVLSLAAEKILMIIDPASGSYQSIFLKLVALEENLKAIKREATIYRRFPGPLKDLKKISAKTNEICLEVGKLISQIK